MIAKPTKKLFVTLVDSGDYEACKEFMRNGGDFCKPNKRGDTGLDVAILKREIPMINFMLEHGANFTMTNPQHNVLDNPVLKNDAEFIRILCEKGAPVDGDMRSGETRPPIFWAVQESKYDALEALLICGANPNIYDEDGALPLVQACGEGDKKIVKLLLKYGADPAQKEKSNTSAIDLATAYGHDNLIPLLK